MYPKKYTNISAPNGKTEVMRAFAFFFPRHNESAKGEIRFDRKSAKLHGRPKEMQMNLNVGL
jgi:hypothetical protein